MAKKRELIHTFHVAVHDSLGNFVKRTEGSEDAPTPEVIAEVLEKFPDGHYAKIDKRFKLV